MKVYDCFLFNNELDLLELRLRTLVAEVDLFVLCEIGHTFMRTEKQLHFHENKKRFAEYLPKIRYVPLTTYPTEPHPAMEHFQRRALALGIADALPGDVVMLGDVDEIPRPEIVAAARALPPEHPVTCLQYLYYYTVNCRINNDWPGTVICARGNLGPQPDMEKLRQNRFHFPAVAHAGWHFSWLGTPEDLAAKLLSIDVERDAAMHGTDWMKKPDPSDYAFLSECRETGKGLFGGGIQGEFVPIEPGFLQPAAISEWLVRHPEYATHVPVA